MWKLFLNYRPLHSDVCVMWPKGTGDLIVQWLFRRQGRTPANWNQTLGVCLIIVWSWTQIQRSYCAPFSTYRNGTPMAPCGAIANSMFNGRWAPPSAPCSGSLLTLFPYPRPGETWCCKVSGCLVVLLWWIWGSYSLVTWPLFGNWGRFLIF